MALLTQKLDQISSIRPGKGFVVVIDTKKVLWHGFQYPLFDSVGLHFCLEFPESRVFM